jgi:hypothetical protein
MKKILMVSICCFKLNCSGTRQGGLTRRIIFDGNNKLRIFWYLNRYLTIRLNEITDFLVLNLACLPSKLVQPSDISTKKSSILLQTSYDAENKNQKIPYTGVDKKNFNRSTGAYLRSTLRRHRSTSRKLRGTQRRHAAPASQFERGAT